jgi:hypothetical protein
MIATRRNLLASGLAAGLAGALPAAPAGAADDRYPFWELRRGGARVYLFGDGGAVTDPWTSPRIEAAFDASAVFWKETPDGSPDRSRAIAAGIDRGRPLSSWLTPAQKDRVAAAATDAGMSYGALEAMKPWLASVVLTNTFNQHYAATRTPGPGEGPASDPIAVLTARAKAAGKPIRTEFASQNDLIDWPNAMTAEQQVEYLMYVIDNNSQPPGLMQQRKREWAAGDMAPETREVARLKSVYPHLYEPLVAERNRRWPARFDEMLAGGGATFVLVGCDHLLGPDGLLALLARAGTPAGRI